jgi:hypothetical protein
MVPTPNVIPNFVRCKSRSKSAWRNGKNFTCNALYNRLAISFLSLAVMAFHLQIFSAFLRPTLPNLSHGFGEDKYLFYNFNISPPNDQGDLDHFHQIVRRKTSIAFFIRISYDGAFFEDKTYP